MVSSSVLREFRIVGGLDCTIHDISRIFAFTVKVDVTKYVGNYIWKLSRSMNIFYKMDTNRDIESTVLVFGILRAYRVGAAPTPRIYPCYLAHRTFLQQKPTKRKLPEIAFGIFFVPYKFSVHSIVIEILDRSWPMVHAFIPRLYELPCK